MSAMQYREYADECIHSAKHSTLVKSAENFYRLRKRGFWPLTFWRPNRGAPLLTSLIQFLELPDLASFVSWG
jgi:hypothetical protein